MCFSLSINIVFLFPLQCSTAASGGTEDGHSVNVRSGVWFFICVNGMGTPPPSHSSLFSSISSIRVCSERGIPRYGLR